MKKIKAWIAMLSLVLDMLKKIKEYRNEGTKAKDKEDDTGISRPGHD